MPHRSFGLYYLRFVGTSAACVGVMGAIGYVPTVRWGGVAAVTAMFVALAISLASSLLGAVPLCYALVTAHEKVPAAALAGTAIRFLVVLPMVALFALARVVEPTPLVVWVVLCYLPLLLIDTVLSVVSVKAAEEKPE